MKNVKNVAYRKYANNSRLTIVSFSKIFSTILHVRKSNKIFYPAPSSVRFSPIFVYKHRPITLWLNIKCPWTIFIYSSIKQLKNMKKAQKSYHSDPFRRQILQYDLDLMLIVKNIYIKFDKSIILYTFNWYNTKFTP